MTAEVDKLKGKSVLIVDDELDLREILVEEFAQHGATAVGAENGAAALALARSRPFDVVVSDVRMPGGDGLTFCRKLRDEFGDAHRIFLYSGFNDVSAETARELDVVAVIPKPCDLNELVGKVRDAL